jgi:hypothetical protein
MARYFLPTPAVHERDYGLLAAMADSCDDGRGRTGAEPQPRRHDDTTGS